MQNFDLVEVLGSDNAVAEFSPASIVVSGKTLVERKMSVVENASLPAQIFLSGASGKVGKMARSGLSNQGVALIARSARSGNYKPMAEAIASLTGESIFIKSRAGFESLQDQFEAKKLDLSLSKNGGYTITTDKKTGDQITRPSSKRKTLEQVIGLITEVQSIIENL